MIKPNWFKRKKFLTRKNMSDLPKSLLDRRNFSRERLTNLPKSLLNRRKWTWKRVLRLAIILFGALIVVSLILFAWYYKDLPKPGELRNQKANESTILYDRNGKQIYDISGEERRILIASQDIPQLAKDATVAIEDHKFYNHHGVDFLAIIRGTILRPFTGKGVQGGSTITQQYIKNAILSPQRSISRKIKEIILATELEFIYTKDEILTLYLNEIPYGGNIYGIEAASQAYYGKSIKEGLTLSQVATLVAIPQSPTYYSPYGTHVDKLMNRKALVLSSMVEHGYITQEEADKAKTESPTVAKDFAAPRDNFPAPHFVMYVREQLVDKYGEDAVQRGGLRVTTTLDLEMQKYAEEAMESQGKTLEKVKASNAAIVAMDPKNGQLLAMMGSLDYFDRENEGNFNVATAERQPGSAGKPIVYAALMANSSYAPSSALWDVDTDFGGGYSPDNFDGKFHGPTSIRNSLGNSFNVPAVKALALAGENKFFDLAKDMGITTFDKRRNSLGLSVALGGGEVQLVDIVAAYSVFANNGDKAPMVAILKVQDSSGKTLDEWKESKKNVLKSEVAYQINSILSDTNAKKPTFTGLLNVLTVNGKTTAVKTGTTNSYRDAWTVGYTPSLVAGVWAGNNDNSEMNRGGGSTAAAPIWDAFMEKALKDKPNEEFFRPESISEQTVDFISGKKPTPSSGQLVKDIFAPWQVPTKDDDVHKTAKVCKSNGKLANENTPSEEVEERVFSVVRSEKPENSAWENPVIAWARGAGLYNPVPTDKCDITISNPKITITSPSAKEEVSGVFSIATNVTVPPNQTAYVDFTLDGSFVSRDESDPYTATIDASQLSNGNHDLAAIVHTSGGGSDTSVVSVVVRRDSGAPGDVTSVLLTPGTVKGEANTTWRNPSDNDLASVIVYVSQSAGVKGSKLATLTANPDTNQSATLTGLVSGTLNYLTFVTVDNSGNQSGTTKQYSVIPL